ncbi:MAG: hypothetical protein MRJ96_15360 [Nitrospirales bacterium]|nr:hypothetical protein [Nitrospira sp.]MDR4502821.1 hypothetical protein [Nitrospirales bacterium]
MPCLTSQSVSPVVFAILIFSFCVLEFLTPSKSLGKPYFEDGFLGLTQAELHQKLGQPMAVRSRKAALRVFSYYTFQDWKKYFSKLVSPENGEDVYTYKRDNVQVRYSFVYIPDLNEDKDFPTLYVRRIEIEFTPAIPLNQIPSLVPEFVPPTDAGASAFRSNLWVLIFKGSPSKEASFIVKERGKENLPWSLAYQMFALDGLPNHLTLDAPIDRMEITAQSLEIVRTNQRLTHEPIVNPYSQEFPKHPPPPDTQQKSIPRPQYAD